MREKSDFFANFGIVPYDNPPPQEMVRAYLPLSLVRAHYVGICILVAMGLWEALFLALKHPFPLPGTIFFLVGSLAVVVSMIYRATRDVYSWVEVGPTTIRAQHLFTRRRVERSIEDIDELWTLVIRHGFLSAKFLQERIRGIEIRFRDQRQPILVSRSGKATMNNAKELIEAIIFRMSQKGRVDVEMVDLFGKPLIRRIYWK